MANDGRKTLSTLLATSAMALTLVGCGGGGGGGGGGLGQGIPPGTGNGGAALSVDGIYPTVSTPAGYTITYSVLQSGEYYGFVYQGQLVYGLVHGTASGNATAIQSGNLSFYNFQGPNGGTLTNGGSLSASFASPPASAFTVTLGATTVVSQAAQQARYSSQDNRLLYSQPLTVAQLAGAYRGSIYSAGAGLGYGTVVGSFSIDASGAFAGTVGNCLGTGSLVPSSPGKGIFNASMVLSGANCGLAGQTAAGILTPTFAQFDASGRLASVGLLLQLLSSSGGAALVFSIGR